MMAIQAALRQRRSRREGNDEGFSLTETLVAAMIFGIFMTMVMYAIISMLNSTSKSTSLQDGQANLEKVFQKLDHQVRYANGIEAPTTLGATGNWYVEWQTQATSLAPLICTELKFDATARTLLQRSWQPASPLTTTTAYKLLASNLVNPANKAFAFTASGQNYAHQQLTISLTTRFGGVAAAKTTTSSLSASFTALNSSTATGHVCQEVAHS